MNQRASTTETAPPPRLPETLRLGPVHLTVTDLDRSVAFYRENIGLLLHHREGVMAALGAGGEDILLLYEEPGARRAARHAGLYHFALLHSSREELGRTVRRLSAADSRIQGASDHGVSEAIYLADPDGNGIELYADHPREAWPDLSKLATAIKPLDLNSVVTAVAGEEVRPEIDPELVVGHLHLHVGDLQHSLAFYRDVLGFDLKTHLPDAAAFVSAGGYHHHLGFNVWRGVVTPVPEGRVGLRHWTIVLENPEEVGAVRERVRAANIETDEREDGGFVARDPWGIAVYFGTTGTVAA